MNKFTFPSIVVLCMVLFLSACQEPKFTSAELQGSWKVAEWKIERTSQLRKNKMDMRFEADMKYVVDYGSEKESGKYWIENEFLHTVETNESEKKVKIISISNDTLRIQMNRGGEIENVVLVKK